MYKDIHILCKSKDKLFVYVYRDNNLYWVTKNKTLSRNERDRAFVSSWDKVEKIIALLDKGEIRV